MTGPVTVALGMGLSSAATDGELRGLAAEALARAGLGPDDVTVVATRPLRVESLRRALGRPVVGVPDEVLVAVHPNDAGPEPAPGGGEPGRAVRFPARVAEGCALEAAGAEATLVVPVLRSAHATAAVAVAVSAPAVAPEGASGSSPALPAAAVDGSGR